MAITFKFRRGTSMMWSANNPTLAEGEPGYDTDTKVLKIGDGSTRWNSLESLNSDTDPILVIMGVY